MSEFSVSLSEIVDRLGLDKVYVSENYEDTRISSMEINRPGLELTGYFEFFDNKRIQILGNTEFSYLGRFGSEAQRMVIDSIFSFGPPAVIICRQIEPSNVILESAKLHKVSIFRTDENTSDLTARGWYNSSTASLLRESRATAFWSRCTAKVVCLSATAA